MVSGFWPVKTGLYDVLGCRISFWGPKGLLVQPVAVTQCYAPVVSPVRSSSPARLGAACVMFVRSFFGAAPELRARLLGRVKWWG